MKAGKSPWVAGAAGGSRRKRLAPAGTSASRVKRTIPAASWPVAVARTGADEADDEAPVEQGHEVAAHLLVVLSRH